MVTSSIIFCFLITNIVAFMYIPLIFSYLSKNESWEFPEKVVDVVLFKTQRAVTSPNRISQPVSTPNLPYGAMSTPNRQDPTASAFNPGVLTQNSQSPAVSTPYRATKKYKVTRTKTHNVCSMFDE